MHIDSMMKSLMQLHNCVTAWKTKSCHWYEILCVFTNIYVCACVCIYLMTNIAISNWYVYTSIYHLILEIVMDIIHLYSPFPNAAIIYESFLNKQLNHFLVVVQMERMECPWLKTIYSREALNAWSTWHCCVLQEEVSLHTKRTEVNYGVWE